jgi:plastocyanin
MSRRPCLFRILRLAALLALLTFPSVAQPAPRAAATGDVSVIDFEFAPKTIVVSVGDTITWKNDGAFTHTVTADDSSFDSGSLFSGAQFSHTFTSAGAFPYHCQIHGTGMSGVVLVGSSTVYLPLITTSAEQ